MTGRTEQALTETEQLASELLLAAVAFERFSVDMTARIMARFHQMERRLVAAIIDVDYQGARTDLVRKARLAELMDVASDIVAQTYAEIIEEVTIDLQTVAEVAEGAVINALALVFGAAFAVAKLRTVPVETLHKIADETRFDGGLLSEWMEAQESDTVFRFKRAVMDAESNDLGTAEVIETITGTREAQRQDGAFQQSRRNAESVVRTMVQAVAGKAKLEAFERNSGDDGVLVGVAQVSTLDGRTSDICIAYSGKRWRYPNYEPLDGLPFNGGTPRHFRCRSQIVPLISLEDEVSGLQSSKYGPVPAHWTYEDWLESRPEEEQRDVLGPTKFDLWKKGKISLSDLVDQRGNPLTVEELLKRFSRRQPD